MVEEVTEGVVTDSGAAVGTEETEKHSISEEPVSQYSPALNVFADIATLISLPRVLVAVTVILYVLSSSRSGISYIVMEPPLRDTVPSFSSEQSPEVSLCQTTV